jgi:hypothetical protein
MRNTTFTLPLHLTVFMLVGLSSVSFAQQETNHWYFGDRVGLDFTSGSPVLDLNNTQMYSSQSSTVASDSAGNLLFYTNGGDFDLLGNDYPGVVCNKNHQVMPNGYLGDTCTYGNHFHSCLAIPKLDNPNQYYLFTSDYLWDTNKGLKYSIIDMTADGGNGDVIVKGVTIIPDSMAQGMVATQHANGIDYWLVCKRYQTNAVWNARINYFIFQITPSGIMPPIIIPEDSLNDYEVTCKFSPDGNLLYSSGGVYNFDKATGQLSNFRPLDGWGYNNAEFSPDNKILYAVYMGSGGFRIRQYDLTAPDISLTATEIDTGSNYYKGGLQLGPDGKIYVSLIGNQLSIIEYPNILGLGCSYQHNAFSLAGRNSWWMFPNFPSNYFSGLIGIESQASGTFPIKTYPNPNLGQFNIDLGKSFEEISVLISDLQGKVVFNRTFKDQQLLRISLDVVPGIYVVRCASGKDVAHTKLLVR